MSSKKILPLPAPRPAALKPAPGAAPDTAIPRGTDLPAGEDRIAHVVEEGKWTEPNFAAPPIPSASAASANPLVSCRKSASSASSTSSSSSSSEDEDEGDRKENGNIRPSPLQYQEGSRPLPPPPLLVASSLPVNEENQSTLQPSEYEVGSRPLSVPPMQPWVAAVDVDPTTLLLRRPSRQIIVYVQQLQQQRRSSKEMLATAVEVMSRKPLLFGPDEVTEALDWTAWRRGSRFDVEAPGQEALLQWESLLPMLTTGEPRAKRIAVFADKRDASAALLQRNIRGHQARRKCFSYRYTRDKLRMAIQSRSPLAVEEALAASRAISAIFLRPPEHQMALVALDIIREEEALRPKLEELVAQSGEKDGQAVVRRFNTTVDRVLRCRSMDEHAFRDATAQRALLVFESARARKLTFHLLKRAIGSRRPDELMRALQESEEVAKCYVGEWEAGFLRDEKRALRGLLVQMQHEEPAIRRLEAAVGAGDAEGVQAASEELAACAPNATAGIHALTSLAGTLTQLDAAVAEARAGSATWTACTVLLGKARAEHMQWAKAAASTCLNTSEAVQKRIAGIADILDRRLGVHDVLNDLNVGISQCDVDRLTKALARADFLQLPKRAQHDPHLDQTLRQAREVVDTYANAHGMLQRALQGNERVPAKLAEAASLARATPLQEGSVDEHLALRCDALCQEAKRLAKVVENSIAAMISREDLEQVLRDVVEVWGLGGMQECAQLRRVLTLPEDKFIHEQLRALDKAGGDAIKRANLLVRLREIYLKSNATKLLRPENFVDLRPQSEWAGTRTRRLLHFGRKKGHDMMVWSAQPLVDRPLTKTARDNEAVGKLSNEASAAFMRCMGDWQERDVNVSPVDALYQVLVGAFNNKEARDELYCILMKQLTKNAGVASLQLGWVLMGVLLDCFPPSPALDIIVEVFIRAHAPRRDELISKLHNAVFIAKGGGGVIAKADLVRLVG